MTDLVEVAFVGDEIQAAIIQGVLEQHGIPSLQEAAAPEDARIDSFVLAFVGGRRRVMVHAHRAEEARAILEEAQPLDELPPGSDPAA